MLKRTVSGITLILVLMSILTLAFNVQLVKTESRIWTAGDDRPDFHKIQENRNAIISRNLEDYTHPTLNGNNFVHPNIVENFGVSIEEDEVIGGILVEGWNYTSFFLANLIDGTHLDFHSPTITLLSPYPSGAFWLIYPPPNSIEIADSEYKYTWSKDVLAEQTPGHSPNLGVSLNYQPYPYVSTVNFDSQRIVSPSTINNETTKIVVKTLITPLEDIERLCVEFHLDETDEVSPTVLESFVNPQPNPVFIGNFTADDRVYWEFHNVRAHQMIELIVPAEVNNKKYPQQVTYKPSISIYSHQGTVLAPWETTIGSNITFVHPRWGNVTFSGEGTYAWTYAGIVPNEIRGVYYVISSTSVQTHGPEAEFTATPDTAAIGKSIKFDASASLPGWNGTHEMPIVEYRWDFDDGNQTTTSTPTVYHSFGSSVIYYVTLTVYALGATPETDTISHKVTIISVPVGGYSIPIKGYTTEKPLTLYLALIAILTASFTIAKRRKKQQN